MSKIEQWLIQNGFGQYAGLFEENAIDDDVLSDLTEPDLEKIGVKLGDRKKLMRAIAALERDPSRVVSPVRAPANHIKPPAPERRQLTVMFCDLVDSTVLTQRLDPEDLRDIARAYQRASTRCIERYDGHLARFMGDGVLAYFGFPHAHEDDAERAVRTALDLLDEIKHLNTTVAREKGVEIAARIGIATGPVVVGELIGEGGAQENAVVGETPNMAARLQNFAVPNSIIITSRTHRLAGRGFQYHNVGEIALKGFNSPIQAWQVVAEKETDSRFDATRETFTPVVGREDELFLLEKRWGRAQMGEGQVVLLSGEAGIGKSRLVLEMQERLLKGSHKLLRLQCSPHHTLSALYPIVSFLERAAEFIDEDDVNERFEKISRVLDGCGIRSREDKLLIADVLSIAPDNGQTRVGFDAGIRKEKALAAILKTIESMVTQPALCIFEDVHWIDPSSLVFLDRLVKRVQALPVMLIVTFRAEFEAPWIGQPHVSYFIMPRMDRRNTVVMAHGVTGGKRLPAEVLEQIVVKTDGVPLFIEELTKTMLETHVLEDRGDHYELSGQLKTLDIPVTLQDSLMARLDRLGEVKEVAQIGAAIGREFSYDLLSAVASKSDATLAGSLEVLAGSELLFKYGEPPHARYVFKHALVQEAAYSSLLRRTRQHYHSKIAEALERRFPAQAEHNPELLAHHYSQARAPEKAAEYWRKAAHRAAARSAHLEAINHVGRGLETLGQLPPGEASSVMELDFQLLLGGSVRATQGYAAMEVETAFSRAKVLCDELGDSSRLFETIWALWLHYLVSGDMDKAFDLAHQVFDLATTKDDPFLMAEAYIASGMTEFQRGEVVRGCEHLRSCVSIYRQEVHSAQAFVYGQDPGVFALSYLAWGSWFLGYPDQAVKQIKKAVSMARDIRHPYSLALALTFAGRIHYCRRDADAVMSVAEETIDVSNQHHFPYYLAHATIQRGWAQTTMGHSSEGMAEMRRGISHLDLTRTVLGRAGALIQLADAYHEAGLHQDAMGVLEDAAYSTERYGSRYWDPEICRLKGVVSMAISPKEQDRAQRWLNEAIEIADARQLRTFKLRSATDLGYLWKMQGKGSQAKKLISGVYDWFSEGEDTPDLRAAKSLLGELSEKDSTTIN